MPVDILTEAGEMTEFNRKKIRATFMGRVITAGLQSKSDEDLGALVRAILMEMEEAEAAAKAEADAEAMRKRSGEK